MSHLPSKPSTSSSSVSATTLPAKPTASSSDSTYAKSSSIVSTPSLLSRISHALPPRPADIERPRSTTREVRNAREARGSDIYIPEERSRDSYYPPSPPRIDWDRSDRYISARSPSPPPVRARRHSDRARSPISSADRQRSPSLERPKTFYTSKHEKSESLAARTAEPESSTSQRAYSAQTSQTTFKRPASPHTSSQPPSKTPRLDYAPRSPLRGVPTGPRALAGLSNPSSGPSLIQTAAYATGKGKTSPRRKQNESSSGKAREDMPPSNTRGRGRGGRGGAASRGNTPRAPKEPIVDGPIMNQAHILETLGVGLDVKTNWKENPKSAVANYYGGSTPPVQVKAVNIEGQKFFRGTLEADDLTAIGDGKTEKEAKTLVMLSLLLQLVATGKMTQKGKGTAAAPASQSGVKLSDGSEVDYDKARQFMDYYCNKFRFGKPDIEFHKASIPSRKGKKAISEWEAVMTVGGRRIGMGSAGSKKAAQEKCYVDVVQYLESCDHELWEDFTDKMKNDISAVIGLAPHLYFQMSENINEDIYGLCGDIRNSTLYRNAPPPNTAAEEQTLPPWQGSNFRRLSPEESAAKSRELQDKLTAYQSDPAMDKMRAQRDALPVKSKASELLAKIEVNDVTVIMAATGSGKTTQVPQLLFDDYINRGEGAKCNILCTQPRRLAATSVAERVADERGDRLGGQVGYQVRFDTKLPQPNGSITFCTTGIFLRRMQSSLGPLANAQSVAAMDQVTHIVIDEVHERDIDTDLSLAVLKRLLADRRARGVPLKVVLMSATIDPTLFQTYFRDERGRPAPVAEVPGRTFPVEKHWLNEIVPDLRKDPRAAWVFHDQKNAKYLECELSPDRSIFGPDTGMDLPVPFSLVALTIAHVTRDSDDGHVLVFLPGWDDIKKVADCLMDPSAYLFGLQFNDASKYSIHYLHSTIPAAEQREVFKPPPKGVRRIILATNIAETSVTIPDVVYVVDTGRVKEKRYDPDRHMSSLVSAWVGQSNLNQRAGRAGRHRPGLYFSLVSNNRYNALNTHQTVEMKRSDLSNVVMHVKALNLGGIEEVLAATIEPPEPSRIVTAMKQLRMLGAMDDNQMLTSLGRVLLQLPIEAAIGKLILFGAFFRCLDQALTLAAVLTNRDPFLAPLALRKEAQNIKDSWSPVAFRSDPLATVAAYNAWVKMDDMGQYRAGNEFCSANFLSKPTLLQIKQVKKSLLQSLEQTGVINVSAGGAVSRLRRRRDAVPPELDVNGNSLPLLAALIAVATAPNFAIRTSERMCRTAQDKSVQISAASVNALKREQGGPEVPSSSFNPAERRIYAFAEKTNTVALGSKGGGQTTLREVTRLDPMTYMLFGAYNLLVTKSGLQCDGWLPVAGNLQALDDITRLKTMFDACMLRVFEGVGKSLVQGRDQRKARNRESIQVAQKGSSHITEQAEDEEASADEAENESDDEEDEGENRQKRIVEPLKMEEIKELELLTTDVVKILDSYSMEREGGSTFTSRPATPADQGYGYGNASGGAGAGGYGRGGGGNAYSRGAFGGGGGRGGGQFGAGRGGGQFGGGGYGRQRGYGTEENGAGRGGYAASSGNKW